MNEYAQSLTELRNLSQTVTNQDTLITYLKQKVREREADIELLMGRNLWERIRNVRV